MSAPFRELAVRDGDNAEGLTKEELQLVKRMTGRVKPWVQVLVQAAFLGYGAAYAAFGGKLEEVLVSTGIEPDLHVTRLCWYLGSFPSALAFLFVLDRVLRRVFPADSWRA